MPPRLLAMVVLIGLSIFINYIDRGMLGCGYAHEASISAAWLMFACSFK